MLPIWGAGGFSSGPSATVGEEREAGEGPQSDDACWMNGEGGKGKKKLERNNHACGYEASTGEIKTLPALCWEKSRAPHYRTYGGLRKTEPGHMEMSCISKLFPVP